MPLYTIPCVLFAGGKSSRMGKDKTFLPFADAATLVQYQYQRLKDIFERVYISTKENNKIFEDFDAIVIEDILAKDVYAPTAGFVNVFRQLNADDAVFVLSVDTPFVSKEVIDKLLAVPMKKLHPRFADEPEENQIIFSSKDEENNTEIDPRWSELKKLKNKK